MWMLRLRAMDFSGLDKERARIREFLRLCRRVVEAIPWGELAMQPDCPATSSGAAVARGLRSMPHRVSA